MEEIIEVKIIMLTSEQNTKRK